MTQYFRITNKDYDTLGAAALRGDYAICVYRTRVEVRTSLPESHLKASREFFLKTLNDTRKFIKNELNLLEEEK